jgi:hypothetical protein
MAFHFLTLKYKEKELEKAFSAHIGPHLLLIIEIILSIFINIIHFYLFT